MSVPQWYGVQVFTLTISVVLGAVVTAGALVLVSRRLAGFAIKGEPV